MFLFQCNFTWFFQQCTSPDGRVGGEKLTWSVSYSSKAFPSPHFLPWHLFCQRWRFQETGKEIVRVPPEVHPVVSPAAPVCLFTIPSQDWLFVCCYLIFPTLSKQNLSARWVLSHCRLSSRAHLTVWATHLSHMLRRNILTTLKPSFVMVILVYLYPLHLRVS